MLIITLTAGATASETYHTCTEAQRLQKPQPLQSSALVVQYILVGLLTA